MPMDMKSKKVGFLPNRDIPREAGTTPRAVPTTIRVIGSVASFIFGAKSAPIMLPISIMRGEADMAMALASANNQTLEKGRFMPLD